MRCPDCTKFVGMEAQDPEVINLEIEEPDDDGEAKVTGEVRCSLACAECGVDLKETTFEIDEDVKVGTDDKGHPGAKHELEIEEVSSEATESGGGRYKKNDRGFTLNWKITCHVEHCGLEMTGEFSHSLPASQWDELA